MKAMLSIMFTCILYAFSINATALTTKNSMNDIAIGVQLWSVRDQLNKDFKGTLKSIADMGFTTIEVFGRFGRNEEFKDNPIALKKYLDQLGLVVSGAHVSFDDISKENLKDTIFLYKTLGAQYLIIGWDTRAWHPEDINYFMSDLNKSFNVITNAGFKFGFHNHDKEFNSYKEQTYWDFIAKNSNKELVLQLDVGWVNYANKDPHHYVKAYQGRTLTTHFKVRTHEGEDKSPLLGQDGFDWASLINTMKTFGGTQWIIVEQEEYPDGLSSLDAVAQSKEGLDKILNNK